MDGVDKLYKLYNEITEDSDKISDHEATYMEIIKATKGNASEKRLACQFIPRLLKHFPNLFESAIEGQIDLVKDDDITVRKLAVKHLPNFCKVSTEFVPKVANILTQMLLSDDASEFTTVQSVLIAVIEIDIKGTLQGILTQMSTAEEDAVRKRGIEFLNAKLKVLPEDLFTKEVEEFFFESCKKVFPKVSGQDFLSLLPLVCHLKIAKSVPVKNAIINIMASKLDSETEFDISEKNICGFINFMKQACPLFSPYVSSHQFVSYISLNIFPLLDEIKNLENGLNLILDVFKVLAEISPYVRKENCSLNFSEIVFNELLKYLPLPPDNSSGSDANASDPNVYFTHIECILFTFVQFLKHDDDIITSADNADRFKDLKIRLQFLSRIITRALKRFKEAKKTVVVVNEESKLKDIAEHTMNNLNIIIKDFFRIPLSFKSNITFSWKIKMSGKSSIKRHYEASSSAGSLPKRERKSRELYVPPSGKYSSRLNYPKDSSSGKSSRF